MAKILSVIVSVYNGAKFLPKFFENINNIDNNIEFLFIDDGSKDNSLDVIKDYIKDKHNMYVYTKENGGVSSARNFGIKKAKGKYIFFADCDDYFSCDAFNIILNNLENNSDIYIFDFYKIVDNISCKSWIKLPDDGEFKIEKNCIIEDYLNGNLNSIIGPALWNKVYKKEIITKNHLCFYESKKLSEDWLFNIEYMLNSNKGYVANKIIYNYVIHQNSATRRYKTWLLEDLEKTYKILPKIAKKYSCKVYEKFLLKLIIPSTLHIIKNESSNEFWHGFISLRQFFCSKKFKLYLKKLDKKSLTEKELLYYFVIITKAYFIIYIFYYITKKISKLFKGV